ncbi:hypothetical protein M231_06161 [Tremella mesenterica]|uniref:SET domain-containing protein n=1 Tax=Tremella mesenterica TaxID=5217 RepID=A0A4Q1BGE0_TREME|nr:uncharacterized protein TREMEDRAFT_58351 [Tremella mesenterica DSM 1558]EIW72193.1 hypothetical protein TREMEDRAFT_58351 [Tremella mesenterica DSM 1558]RXK36551.1 hypothetical protein M231_06161 [Tremella mesenterica]
MTSFSQLKAQKQKRISAVVHSSPSFSSSPKTLSPEPPVNSLPADGESLPATFKSLEIFNPFIDRWALGKSSTSESSHLKPLDFKTPTLLPDLPRAPSPPSSPISSGSRRSRSPSCSPPLGYLDVVETAPGPSKSRETNDLVHVNTVLEMDKEGVEVKIMNGRRGLFAKRRFAQGSVVLTRPPFVSVLSTPQLPERCSYCLLSPLELSISRRSLDPSPLERCEVCETVAYCSSSCATKDRSLHDYECRALRMSKQVADAASVPPEHIRALARLAWSFHTERSGTSDKHSRINAMKVLEDHLKTTFQGDKELEKQIEEHRAQCLRISKAVMMFIAMGLPNFDPQNPSLDLTSIFNKSTGSILQVISSFMINTFSASSPSLDLVGAALNPAMAMSNHSCSPNAVVVFPEGADSMRIVAIKAIEAGEEVLTHYVDLALPYAQRQAELRRTYHFECKCPTCDNRTKDGDKPVLDPRSILIHRECKSVPPGGAKLDLFQTNWRHISNLVREGQAMLDEDDRQGLDTSVTPLLTEELIPGLSGIIPHSSWPLLPLLRIAARTTVKLTPQDVEKAVGYYETYCQGARQVYPADHPVLAVVAAEAAKTLALTVAWDISRNSLTRCVEAFSTAAKACGIAFGPGGGIVGAEMLWEANRHHQEYARRFEDA